MAIYFKYKPPNEFSCPICLENDPILYGGTIAHGSWQKGTAWIDGRSHPIHLRCVLPLGNCPVCRIQTDLNQVIPLSMKYILTVRWFFRIFSSKLDRVATWIRDPKHQFSLGSISLLSALIFQKNFLASLGLGLQMYALHQAIEKGGSLIIANSREIGRIAKDLLQNGIEQSRLAQLQSLVASHPFFNDKHLALLENSPKKNGLKQIALLAQEQIRADQNIRIFRAILGIASLYFAFKSIQKLNFRRQKLPLITMREDVFSKIILKSALVLL